MPSVLDYLEFSQLAYDLSGGRATDGTGVATVPIPTGWTVMPNPALDHNGLTAYAFINSDPSVKQIVVAFRGSVTGHDWVTADGAGIALGHRPAQFDNAESYVQSIISANPGYTVLVTGHSLGADEAEDVAARLNLGGVTFAAPGVSNLLTAGTPTSAPGLTNYDIVTDPVAEASKLAGSHVGTEKLLTPVTYLSNLFLEGALGVTAGVPGVGTAIGLAALTQHPLYSYGSALLAAGIIPTNPIPEPIYVFGDLNVIYQNIKNFVTGTDASGNITESGTIVSGSGTVIVSEELLSAGGSDFDLTATSGSNVATQTANINSSGVVTSDQIILNGAIINPSVMPDINMSSGGNLLIGVPSQTQGDEVTVETSGTGSESVMVGGDAVSSSQQIVNYASGGLSGDTLSISYGNSGNVILTTEIAAGATAAVSSDSAVSNVTQAFDFQAASGELELLSGSSLSGAVTGFSTGATPALTLNLTATSATVTNGSANAKLLNRLVASVEPTADGGFLLGLTNTKLSDSIVSDSDLITQNFNFASSSESEINFNDGSSTFISYNQINETGPANAATATAAAGTSLDMVVPGGGGNASLLVQGTAAANSVLGLTLPDDLGVLSLSYTGPNAAYDINMSVVPGGAIGISFQQIEDGDSIAVALSDDAAFGNPNVPWTYNTGGFEGSVNGTLDVYFLSFVQISNGSTLFGRSVNLDVPSSVGSVNIVQNGAGANVIFEDVAPCFLSGTRISTPHGYIPVDELQVGDSVITAIAGTSVVRWLGRRVIDCDRHPTPTRVWPVCVRGGAFGDGRPSSDLWLSPDHAVYVDDLLIPIRRLINGASIVQEPRPRVSYHHVELAQHDILMAEGLPVESYIDTGNRAMFSNAGTAMLLHPDFATVNVGLKYWEYDACARLADKPEEVEPVWQRLAARARTLGYVEDKVETISDPQIRLEASGSLIAPLCSSNGRHSFVLPPNARKVYVRSRAGAPTDIRPWIEDSRRLGIYVSRIGIRNGAELTEIPVDHPSLMAGWWNAEHDGNQLWRWTNGRAEIPLPPGTGLGRALILELTASGQDAYQSPAEKENEAKIAA